MTTPAIAAAAAIIRPAHREWDGNEERLRGHRLAFLRHFLRLTCLHHIKISKFRSRQVRLIYPGERVRRKCERKTLVVDKRHVQLRVRQG